MTEYTLDKIKMFVSGDNQLTPRLSGPQLISLFNSVGERDVYNNGLPENASRNQYVLNRLKKIDNSPELKKLLEIVFSERHFAGSSLSIDNAVSEFNKVAKPEGIELIKITNEYKFSSSDIYDEIKTSEIHFEDIQSQIIQELEKAKFLVWVAVAWFTNKELYDILHKKRVEGLSIQALIIDDEINANSKLNFGKDFYVIKVPKKGYFENIMHNKFCVIDLKTVIHGTYNWTTKANYNNETIDVENGWENAEKFAEQFIKLKLKSGKV